MRKEQLLNAAILISVLTIAPSVLGQAGTFQTPPANLGTQVLSANDGWASTAPGTTGGSAALAVGDLVASAIDNCDSSLNLNSVTIAQVSSDEGSAGSGDIVLAADCKSVQLRADRNGNGDGRVYTLTFRVRDVNGNTSEAVARVIVPHDQGHPNAVDSGPAYTVTGACP